MELKHVLQAAKVLNQDGFCKELLQRIVALSLALLATRTSHRHNI